MNKPEKSTQESINDLNKQLFKVDNEIKSNVQPGQIRMLERERLAIETELMSHYGTEKYGLLLPN
jgi:hypothetical protein